MNEKAEKLLTALKSRENEHINLYKALRSTNDHINGMVRPASYVHTLVSDLRNYVAEMYRHDSEIERAVRDLLDDMEANK